MPEPAWNDPDWPKTLSGWVVLSFVWCSGVGTLVILCFLIGGSL